MGFLIPLGAFLLSLTRELITLTFMLDLLRVTQNSPFSVKVFSCM